MYEEQIRSMNDRERATLRSSLTSGTTLAVTLGHTLKWVLIWTGGLFVCALAAVLLIMNFGPVIGGLFGGLIGVAGILCVYFISSLITSHFHWNRHAKRFSQEVVPAIQEALRDGRVQVKQVRATAVVEIQEFEDEGAGFIFDVEEGKLLFLKGQIYWPAEESMEWPNSEFEIVHSVHGNRWIGIFCNGRKLDPVRILDYSQLREDILLNDREELIAGNLMEFSNSLMKESGNN